MQIGQRVRLVRRRFKTIGTAKPPSWAAGGVTNKEMYIASGSLVRKTTGTIEIEPMRAFATAALMFVIFAGVAVFADHEDGLSRGIGSYATAAVFSLIVGFWSAITEAAKR